MATPKVVANPKGAKRPRGTLDQPLPATPALVEEPPHEAPAADEALLPAPAAAAEDLGGSCGGGADAEGEAAASGVVDRPALSVSQMLAVGSLQEHASHVTTWAAKIKESVDKALLEFLSSRKNDLSFPLPSSLQLLAPLAIRTAASGAALSAFREVMNYDNLVASFHTTGQYEAAGTVLDVGSC